MRHWSKSNWHRCRKKTKTEVQAYNASHSRQEDRFTTTGDMHRKFRELRTCRFYRRYACGQTYIQARRITRLSYRKRSRCRTLREAVELAEERAERPVVRQIADHVHPGTQRRHHDVTMTSQSARLTMKKLVAVRMCRSRHTMNTTAKLPSSDVTRRAVTSRL